MTDVKLDLPIVDEPAGRKAVAGKRVRVDDMTTYVPETITRVREWLDARGVRCIDPPLTIFLGPGVDEWLDVEVGWPIDGGGLDVSEGIVLRELPPTRAVQHVHRGPYEGLPDVFRALEPAIREQGLRPLELAREHYVGHPNNTAAPSRLRDADRLARRAVSTGSCDAGVSDARVAHARRTAQRTILSGRCCQACQRAYQREAEPASSGARRAFRAAASRAAWAPTRAPSSARPSGGAPGRP